ncbi:MAG: DUF1588 domain-containing protein [Chthoniobacteraceae bacterium]
MCNLTVAALLCAGLVAPTFAFASPALLETQCAECHSDKKAKGKFKLTELGERPAADNLKRWVEVLDLITAGEMPPEDESDITAAARKDLASFVKGQLGAYEAADKSLVKSGPRRLNNREFANSIRDVLMIEDVGTHQPVANLIGDSLHHGFDTHSATLGFSKFHLEQYIDAVRKIVDATILSGDRPASRRIEVPAEKMFRAHTSQNTKRSETHGANGSIDFLDPKSPIYFKDFAAASATGRYKITIRATGKDRNVYASEQTGIREGDPIRLSVSLGDRVKTFDLPEEKPVEIVLDEWIAAGSRLQLFYPTDGLTLVGNGNFKFEYRIAGQHLKEHDPARYAKIVAGLESKKPGRTAKGPDAWQHWVDYWQGPRPVIYSAVVEGPFYESWPTKRQVALIGDKPSVANAAAILQPIAERAWRRPVHAGELDSIVALVKAKAKTMNEIEALKEGIVAVLVSPAFLLLNTDDLTPEQRFASKFSTFLGSTLPDAGLRAAVAGGKLNSFADVRAEVQRRFDAGQGDPFLRAFPFAWLLLNDINFMAPDPDHYVFYHRKRVSEDMTAEALEFFRHAVANNLRLPEFLAADYSFINADLAEVYGATKVPADSKLRKFTFADGHRGGLLGMGAFLTITADTLSTSPIHRAKYVMENFLGIHPSPPPADVKIEEPDVRQAKTIREILAKHSSDANCASCHKTIDPYGYAFENFDPMGAWRDAYIAPTTEAAGDAEADAPAKKKRQAAKAPTIPIDASAEFRNGAAYQNIQDYRKLMLNDANRDRFVRCVITKLLTYANGEEPRAGFAVDQIVEQSAKHGYRIVDTIAAVIDSPLFREE